MNISSILNILRRVRGVRSIDAAERVETFNKVESALPSRFSLIYTSKDGRYCLYETKDGNLISADTNNFV